MPTPRDPSPARSNIQLPHKYSPRPYQQPFLTAMDNGFLRAVLVWHRRAGKDKSLVNFVAKKMMERVGAYYYFFPTYRQGKKILWKGMDRDGVPFLDHFPQALRYGKPNDTDMSLQFMHPTATEEAGSPKPGSLFQVIGTDNIDSIVGTNPVGCVFSEFALQDPRAWDFIRPILAENGGWAVFNFTPRGENHGYDIFQLAESSPDWFCQLLTAADTKAIPEKVLEQERLEIIRKDGNDALYQQEYQCSFSVPIAGAYFAQQLMTAQEEGRISQVPHEPTLKVDTYWDLGIGDSTTIWLVQMVGKEKRLIDYYETSGEGLAHYAKVLQDKPYNYGRHWAPHDIEVRELGTGKSRLETARKLGIKFDIVPNIGLEDGIEAVRNVLNSCWFDKEKCRRGLNALKSYHKEYDDKNNTYKDRPYHDWSSHGADAFRMFAVAVQEEQPAEALPAGAKKNWNIGE